MKYATIQDVVDAFNSGELSRDEWSLQVDNDHVCLMYVGKRPAELKSDEAIDAWDGQKYDEAQELFQQDIILDPVELFRMFGIPAEHV